MAYSRVGRLARFARQVKDGDLAGATFELARTAVLMKVALPLLALFAVLLIVLVVIVGALAHAGNAAAQGCGVQASATSLNTSGAGPVGAPAPAADVPLFQAAAVQFTLGPEGPSILAAINEVETTFGTSDLPGVHSGANHAGAEGPMQFEPGTWARYGLVAPGGASPASPYNENDAVWSAANLLRASGAPNDWQAAIFAYNHAGWYVDEVLYDAAAMYRSGKAGSPSASSAGNGQPAPTDSIEVAEQCAAEQGIPTQLTPGPSAQILPGGAAAAPQDAPEAVKRAIAAGNELIDKPYLYGGGHGQALTSIASSYDCSSSTSFVLYAAGVFGSWPEDSTQLESYGVSGPGRWITVYANKGHAFIDVAGIVLDTAWYWRSATGALLVQPIDPSSGPRWQPASIIAGQYADNPASYGAFVQRHPARL
jgi:hypothetical protein